MVKNSGLCWHVYMDKNGTLGARGLLDYCYDFRGRQEWFLQNLPPEMARERVAQMKFIQGRLTDEIETAVTLLSQAHLNYDKLPKRRKWQGLF